MIDISVTVDTSEVINNLNKIKSNSNQSLAPIVTKMANETKEVAKNCVPPKVNWGDLLTGFRVLATTSEKNRFENVLYNACAYAQYVHDGTSGTWYTHYSDPRLVVAKLDKYGMQPVNGSEFYEFHGQKPNPFMEIAFRSTLTSNQSLAKSMYYEYILKGTR